MTPVSPPPTLPGRGTTAVALRPATAADMPAVARLIRELAGFEREPDAPALTVEDLVRDGFPPQGAAGGGMPPAFHVILAVVAPKGGGDGSGGGGGSGHNDGDGDVDGDSRGRVVGGCDGSDGGGNVDGGGDVDGDRVRSSDGVVGMALWHHTYSTWAGRALYVEDLIVTAGWRGCGIGRRLLAAAAAAAVATRCARMDWVVYEWNAPAIGFYTRAGATVRGNLRLMRVEGKALSTLGGGSGGRGVEGRATAASTSPSV